MFVEKQKVLNDALITLNNDNQPWKVIVEGDSIIGKWKWEDARFFSPNGLTDRVKNFAFKVTLNDDGKWHEMDVVEEKEVSYDITSGKISFEKSFLNGNTNRKTFTIGVGQDNKTSEVGVINSNFDTSLIKEPIRNYLKKCGWTNSDIIPMKANNLNAQVSSYCTKCGNPITFGMKFCNKCGNQINSFNQTSINSSNNLNSSNSKNKNNVVLIVVIILVSLLGSLFLFGSKIDFGDDNNTVINDFVGEWYCIYRFQTDYIYNYKVIIKNNNTYIYGDSKNIEFNNYNGSYTMNYNVDKNYYEVNFNIDNYIENGQSLTPENDVMHYVIQSGPLYTYRSSIVKSVYMASLDTSNEYMCFNKYISPYDLNNIQKIS